MAMMARYPDKHFDIAIVDPPYGIGMGKLKHIGLNSKTRKQIFTSYKGGSDWDENIPNEEYFKELFRVSKNQIIWGANHFVRYIPPSRGWVFWDKGATADLSFSDAEFAFTSFNRVIKRILLKRSDWRNCISASKELATANPNKKIHPTQKPTKLYKWLLEKYATPGQNILDTHLGSGSIAIACHDYGYDLTACELDTDYYNAAMKRIHNHQSQTKLFEI